MTITDASQLAIGTWEDGADGRVTDRSMAYSTEQICHTAARSVDNARDTAFSAPNAPSEEPNATVPLRSHMQPRICHQKVVP